MLCTRCARRHASAAACACRSGVPRERARRPAGRSSMSTVITVRRGTVISCDVVTRCVGGRAACVRGTSAARHSCSQSVSLWARYARGHMIAGWLFLSPPGHRLLTDITCATADQPACHVIATAATYTERSPTRSLCFRLHHIFFYFVMEIDCFCEIASFIFHALILI